MRIQDWVDRWEKVVPLDLQEAWDHSGKQVGDFGGKLTGVVMALDLTHEAIDRAVEEGANFIFTHHPLFFSPLEDLVYGSPRVDLLVACIEKKIAVYASHTPFDRVDGGVNDVLAEEIGLRGRLPLEDAPLDSPHWDLAKGMGRLGRLVDPMPLKEYAERIQEKLDLPSVTFYGDPDAPVDRVACLGGSGMDFVPQALEKGAQVLVTSDIKYHDAQNALRQGLFLVDLSHYGSEFPAMKRAMNLAGDFAPEVPVTLVENGLDSKRWSTSHSL